MAKSLYQISLTRPIFVLFRIETTGSGEKEMQNFAVNNLWEHPLTQSEKSSFTT